MLFAMWERYRRIVISGVILFFLFLSYLLYPDSSTDRAPGLPLTPAYASELEHKKDETPAQNSKPLPPIFIDVKGNVKKPGLYSFEQGSRIADAIEKAGGILPEADLNQINLAQPLLDGSMLLVPKKGEFTKATPCNNSIGIIQSVSQNNTIPSNTNANPAASGEKVNLNTASLQQLMTLPGIGETRAKEIVNFREKNGPFRTTDQLKKISGIGDKTYEKLKSKITI